MKRGEVFSAAIGYGLGTKPRPVLMLQADEFGAFDGRLVALITSHLGERESIRPAVEPDAGNGLLKPSVVMVDALFLIRSDQIGRYIGQMSARTMRDVDAALTRILGIGSQ